MSGVISWVGTWITMILLLVILSKTRWGKTLVYWLLWLAVILLLVSHADEISNFFDAQALQLNG